MQSSRDNPDPRPRRQEARLPEGRLYADKARRFLQRQFHWVPLLPDFLESATDHFVASYADSRILPDDRADKMTDEEKAKYSFEVIRNHVLDSMRREARHAGPRFSDRADGDWALTAPPLELWKILAVREALEQLSAVQREIIRLRFMEPRRTSIAGIVRLLREQGVSLNCYQVRIVLKLAMKRLRDLLQD